MKKKMYRNVFQGEKAKFRSKSRRAKKENLSPSSDNQLASHDHPYPPILRQHHPISLLPLIGRQQEMKDIAILLQRPEVRLLTLTGPGGVGKTRLALQIPIDACALFKDGISFVSLVHIWTSDAVIPTIAHTLGLTEGQNVNTLAQVQAAIGEKRFLLILDNFEHVTMAAPQLKELLAACPELKIVVTSRSVLGLLEEQEFYVHPLSLPNLNHPLSCEELTQVPAVSLFLQRVQTVRPDFHITKSNAQAIAKICVHLDGLPLALELAAARMKLFSPQSLLHRLNSRLSLLTSGPCDVPERQQTLRKTIEWSYDLLTSEEQQLLRYLSVFVGGCSLQAIETISRNITGERERPILNIVTSLLNQSLLQREAQTSNYEQRFIMLETIREYALERLQSSNEEETTRHVHAEYYLALAKTLEQKVMGGEPPHWVEWIESEFENLRVAFDWFLFLHDGEKALEMSEALWTFWLQSSTAEGYHWLLQALECSQQSVTAVHDETRAMAMQAAAMLSYYRSNWTQADAYIEEAFHLFQITNNSYGTIKALITKGIGALLRGQYATASTAAHESLRLLKKSSHLWLSAEAHLILAYSSFFQTNYQQAYTIGKKSFKASRQTGELYAMIRATHAYALFATAHGYEDEVQEMHDEIMSITRATMEIDIHSPIAVCLVGLGAIAALQKHYIWAVNLWGKAKSLYKRRDGLSELEPRKWLTIILGTHLLYSHMVDTVHTQLSEETFLAAWNDGQSMPLEQLLVQPPLQKRLLRLPSSEKISVAYSDDLTPREKEVLCLLAQAMSSASIAKHLGISLVTVNSHIRAIYSKLGVSSRSAATRFALEHHLV